MVVYDETHSPPGTSNEITDTAILFQNINISPSNPLVTIASDVVNILAIGIVDIGGYIQDKANAIRGGAGKLAGAPGSSAYHYGFIPNEAGSSAGFSYVLGQSRPANPHYSNP